MNGAGDYFGESINAQPAVPPAGTPVGQVAAPAPCRGCGGAAAAAPAFAAGAAPRIAHPFVYAFGRIEPRFPSIGVEKEFAQLATRSKRSGVDDAALVQSVLGHQDGRYLARHLTWVLAAYERDAFVIVPRDAGELEELVEASAAAKGDRLTLIVGRAAPGGWWAPDAGEPGLPRYGADQIASFEIADFVKKAHRPDDVPDDSFRETVRSIFDRIVRRANNTGEHDDARALNYMALRYGAMYDIAARAAARGMRLTDIQAASQLSPDGRRAVAIRLRFRNVGGDLVESYGCRIDVTEQFPFIAAPLQQVFDV